MHLCYACGLRRNEAGELKITDIDLENNLLYIRKGKGKKRRVIPFTKQVKKDIEIFLLTEAEVRHRINENLLNISYPKLYYEFRKLLKKTGLENKGFTLALLTPHNCNTVIRARNGAGESKRFFRTSNI